MATESSFSKGWRASGIINGAKSALALRWPFCRHYQEFACAIGCSRYFLDDIAAWERHRMYRSHTTLSSPDGTQRSVEHAQCQKEGHMSHGKDNQPNCVHIPRSRDSFTGQW